MPQLGDKRRNLDARVYQVYARCPNCGNERWVRFSPYKSKTTRECGCSVWDHRMLFETSEKVL